MRRYRERPLTSAIFPWTTSRCILSGDIWLGVADDDGLRGSKEGDDNIEE